MESDIQRGDLHIPKDRSMICKVPWEIDLQNTLDEPDTKPTNLTAAIHFSVATSSYVISYLFQKRSINTHHFQEGCREQQRAINWVNWPTVGRFEPMAFRLKRLDVGRLTIAGCLVASVRFWGPRYFFNGCDPVRNNRIFCWNYKRGIISHNTTSHLTGLHNPRMMCPFPSSIVPGMYSFCLRPKLSNNDRRSTMWTVALVLAVMVVVVVMGFSVAILSLEQHCWQVRCSHEYFSCTDLVLSSPYCTFQSVLPAK